MIAIKRLLFGLALALITLKAGAVQMIPLSIEDMTKQSDVILHGTVTSKVCDRDPSGRIYTRLELDVVEVLKGNVKSNKFTVVYGGGKVGNVRSEVSGQADFDVGEEVVTFLVLNQRSEGVTLGLAQGKFKVWKDKETGEKFAHNIFHGAKEKESEREEKKATRLALKDLTQRVKGGGK